MGSLLWKVPQILVGVIEIMNCYSNTYTWPWTETDVIETFCCVVFFIIFSYKLT